MAIGIPCVGGPVPDGDDPLCPVCHQQAEVYPADTPAPLGGTFMRHYVVHAIAPPLPEGLRSDESETKVATRRIGRIPRMRPVNRSH